MKKDVSPNNPHSRADHFLLRGRWLFQGDAWSCYSFLCMSIMQSARWLMRSKGMLFPACMLRHTSLLSTSRNQGSGFSGVMIRRLGRLLRRAQHRGFDTLLHDCSATGVTESMSPAFGIASTNARCIETEGGVLGSTIAGSRPLVSIRQESTAYSTDAGIIERTPVEQAGAFPAVSKPRERVHERNQYG